jgi:hypothetical protein
VAKKKAAKRIRVDDPAAPAATQTPAKADTPADPEVATIEARDRQYVGPWGPEWICQVRNLEHHNSDGVIWTCVLNADERRFLNDQLVQLSEGHLEVLDHAVIVDQTPIPDGSAYYLNPALAQQHNPGMKYKIVDGVPHMTRSVKRYMYSKIRPAMKAPLVHGGVPKEE